MLHSMTRSFCRLSLLLPLLLRLPAPAESQCTAEQWVSDSCAYKFDGACDVTLGYCSSGTDCCDCDPCSASIAGYGGCSQCVSMDGCSWCKHSGLCRSTAARDLVPADGSPSECTFCESGWVTDSCEAGADVVAGQQFNDPAVQHQRWYLEAINVGEAWALGYTGEGVNIFFHDDALDIEHSDFKDKYNAAGSPAGHDPKSSDFSEDDHGTAVVGYAAAAANNSVCGVGVAFDSTISFAKFSESYTAVFTTGVDNNVNHVHSNSWGLDACPYSDAEVTTAQPYAVVGSGGDCPFNDTAASSPCGGSGDCSGMDWSGSTISAACTTMIRSYCNSNLGAGLGLYDPACADHWDLWIDCEHKGLSLEEAVFLQQGVRNGRNGKGIIYVFAAGNEFTEGDNVNFEGWLNSIHTISVAATALDGEHSYYSSAGAAVHIAAPGGETGNGKMPTAKPGTEDGCGDGGQGTSYATPVVSGVVALMLQANNDLGWRDVQDILARSAAPIDETHSSWTVNGAGLKHSDLYGFGLIDAGAAVVMARDWPAANSKEHALLGKHVDVDALIPSDEHGLQCGVAISQADASHIESVEHVVVYITTSGHDVRGELEILLTSPAGTQSLMAWATSADGTPDYENFKFMTVKNWGETAEGTWSLQVKDKRENNNEGRLVSWLLAVYGKCDGAAASGEDCRKVLSPRLCAETCQWSDDGECDDGGANGELTQYCSFGTDCLDCGPRDLPVDTVHGSVAFTEGGAACAVAAATSTSSTRSSSSSTPSSSSSSSMQPETSTSTAHMVTAAPSLTSTTVTGTATASQTAASTTQPTETAASFSTTTPGSATASPVVETSTSAEPWRTDIGPAASAACHGVSVLRASLAAVFFPSVAFVQLSSW